MRLKEILQRLTGRGREHKPTPDSLALREEAATSEGMPPVSEERSS